MDLISCQGVVYVSVPISIGRIYYSFYFYCHGQYLSFQVLLEYNLRNLELLERFLPMSFAEQPCLYLSFTRSASWFDVRGPLSLKSSTIYASALLFSAILSASWVYGPYFASGFDIWTSLLLCVQGILFHKLNTLPCSV